MGKKLLQIKILKYMRIKIKQNDQEFMQEIFTCWKISACREDRRFVETRWLKKFLFTNISDFSCTSLEAARFLFIFIKLSYKASKSFEQFCSHVDAYIFFNQTFSFRLPVATPETSNFIFYSILKLSCGISQ